MPKEKRRHRSERLESSSSSEEWRRRKRNEKRRSPIDSRSIKRDDKKFKKHQERRSSRSSLSDSSTSSNDSIKLLQKFKKERLKQAEERKREKELQKANETPEEKRLRRLMKKEAKERNRKERMGWDNARLHYTNTDNPFGDGNLLSTFVWKKKLAKEGLVGVSPEELRTRNRFKQEENKRELEKVEKRRLEIELERQKREEEMQLMQRNKEAAQFEEWERYEDQFHLEQATLRSRIRIQNGRAKPIDLLGKYISAKDEVDAVEMHEPYTYLNGLQIEDLEDLVEDIKVYEKLERGKNFDYWTDITVIVEDELQKLRKLEKQNEYDAGRRESINQAVATDVTAVFKGKTSLQLTQLQNQIESRINGKVDRIDFGYWESLLSQLKAHMARARLRERHQESLKRKLQVLKAEQAVTSPTHEDAAPSTSSQSQSQEDVKPTCAAIENKENSNGLEDAYEAGGYSPKFILPDAIEPGTVVVTEEDDLQRLEFARLQVTSSGNEDEAQFSVEAALDSQVYLWSDKYRPRKPRYLNRVQTGFEWNKYNRTHYDMDNPPPKIVQGYKFNIFYPDLIDKNETPQYFLTPCGEDGEFAVLRFHAGPPYEDIAFKIVNREWEHSYKRGYKCQFNNNILQLYIQFKRYRYRR